MALHGTDLESKHKYPRRVSVEEAENGFIVHLSDEKGNSKMMVAKDMNEANEMMSKMMGMKMKKSMKTSDGKMMA